MGEIKIDTNKLKNSAHEISVMPLRQGNVLTAVNDTSKESLDNCVQSLSQNAQNINDVVQKYSDFLTSLAEKFKNQDNMLSEKFGFTPTIQKSKRKKTVKSDLTQSDDYFE